MQVDDKPRLCPSCGLPSGRLKRRDNYLSLFFIPLFPVKRGEPFVECNRCQGVFPVQDSGYEMPAASKPGPKSNPVCQGCRQLVDERFVYCPWCGRRL